VNRVYLGTYQIRLIWSAAFCFAIHTVVTAGKFPLIARLWIEIKGKATILHRLPRVNYSY